jgi:hypothetical protein
MALNPFYRVRGKHGLLSDAPEWRVRAQRVIDEQFSHVGRCDKISA